MIPGIAEDKVMLVLGWSGAVVGMWESVTCVGAIAELSFSPMSHLSRHLSADMIVSFSIIKGQGNACHLGSCGKEPILQSALSPSEACHRTTCDKHRSKVLVNLVCN